MDNTLKICPLAGILILSGCAGSAAHKVVTANQADDSNLSCQQIDLEMAKAQAIIDEVNKDKDDVSGADVIDGILWFPFNLIAKHQNYNDALEAADRRMAHLNELKAASHCDTSEDEIQEKADALVEQLRALSSMHQDGTITDDEYQAAKQKLLNQDN